MRTRSSALSRTFTALPTSWLWPAGPPIWQMSALGVVVALSAVAVPALPTVLPDKPPSSPAPAVAGPVTGHDRSTDAPEAVPTSDISTTPSATSVPEVSAVVPSQQPGETPSEAPTATSSASPSETSETPTEGASPTQDPPASTDPIETTAPAAPAKPSTTIAATDPGNQRWLVTGTKCATCASGSRIVGTGLLATLTVPFSADGDGTRQLTIAYETKLQRNLYVSVNGATPRKLTLAGTGGWKQPGWTSISIEAKTGSNILTFSNPLGLAPDLDQFTIS